MHGAGAKAGIQLGHAGRKGSTKVAWEGIDQPLEDGRLAADLGLGCALSAEGSIPRAMTRDDMDRVRDDFIAATRRAAASWLSNGSSCIARTAICCRAFFRR